MNETLLARLEPQLFSGQFYSRSRHEPSFERWRVDVEASCWLRLQSFASEQEVLFCFQYTDALKKYSVLIDRVKLKYFKESLVAGKIPLEGFGTLSQARLVFLIADGEAQVQARDVQFKLIHPVERLRPSFKLVV